MARPRAAEGRQLLDARGLARCLERLARQIAAAHGSLADTVLVGVQTRGVPIARRLAVLLERRSGVRVPVGALDITLYRDDLTTIAEQPLIRGTDIPVSIDGKDVILADDVLFTGRTARAALDELIDFGRPARIELLALVDRGHRELPIHADFVGVRVTTGRDQIVHVQLAEEDGADRVLLASRFPAAGAGTAGRPRRAPRRARG